MFLQVSACPQGGVSLPGPPSKETPLWRGDPLGKETPQPWQGGPPSREPPGREIPRQGDPPGRETSPPDKETPWQGGPLAPPAGRPPGRACWEIRSMRGQYASYWNAILFCVMSIQWNFLWAAGQFISLLLPKILRYVPFTFTTPLFVYLLHNIVSTVHLFKMSCSEESLNGYGISHVLFAFAKCKCTSDSVELPCPKVAAVLN